MNPINLPEMLFWAVQVLLGFLVAWMTFNARMLATVIKDLQKNNVAMQIEIARIATRLDHLEKSESGKL